jgi:hypothetical protein
VKCCTYAKGWLQRPIVGCGMNDYHAIISYVAQSDTAACELRIVFHCGDSHFLRYQDVGAMGEAEVPIRLMKSTAPSCKLCLKCEYFTIA